MVQGTAGRLVNEPGGWRRWVVSVVILGGAIVATLLLVASFFPGDGLIGRLDAAYRWLWEGTTRRQFTEIMRERPWLLILPGGTLLFVTGLVLPLRHWARALMIYLAFGIGVVVGHVFW